METARFHESKGSSHLAQNFIHAAGAIAAGVATAASTVVHLVYVCIQVLERKATGCCFGWSLPESNGERRTRISRCDASDITPKFIV